MQIQEALRRSVLVLPVLALLLGIANSTAWALGPGASSIIREAYVYVYTRDDAPPKLYASAAVEVPGGRMPQNIVSVTVLVPGETAPRVMPREILDLAPDRGYFLDLTGAGVVGFPTGIETLG